MRSILPTLATLTALTAQDAGSSFGMARTRAAAELGRLPTPLEVAVPDIVNYHRHRLPLPRGDDEVMLQLRFGNGGASPGGTVVLQLGYTTAPGDDRADLPPLNLALVVDRSGSMADADKLTQVKAALVAFVARLRGDDRVALVTYSETATVDQASRAVGDGRWLCRAIEAISPGGATNLHAGLMSGLREVAAHAFAGSSNRVLLLTDGIANRGECDPERILAETAPFTAEDIDLSTIGVGENLDTELLDRLARGGRGLFHFVADPSDVRKVFVQEHEALVAPVARRVRLEVDLPPHLSLERVVGHDFCRRHGAVVVDLPNLNRGATGVVLMVCRLDDECPRDDTTARVRARLVYDAAGGRRRVDGEEALAVVLGQQELLRDPEVRKNYTIGVLAEGMHEMARLGQCQRWGDADRALDRALRFARDQFRTDDDADVARVRTMAEGHAATLRRYVDRFRDQ